VTAYLVDTNVISETARSRPNSNVLRWLGEMPMMMIPAVTVYEISAGILRLTAGKRRDFLEQWFAELLGADGDVLPFDRDAALACAELEAEARRRQRTIEQRDLLILAIAKSRALGVATRNVAHFRGYGVPVYDPFEDVHII
jgi:toxin FitB